MTEIKKILSLIVSLLISLEFLEYLTKSVSFILACSRGALIKKFGHPIKWV